MEREVRLIAKHRSRAMRVLGLLLGRRFVNDFWTTYRLPFQSHVTVAHPPRVTRPEAHADVLAHEMHHVRQFTPWWGPVVVPLLAGLLPLPFLFSGRWFVERGAYLEDIRRGRYDVSTAVEVLWRHYAWAWPRPLMRRWFVRRLEAPRGR